VRRTASPPSAAAQCATVFPLLPGSGLLSARKLLSAAPVLPGPLLSGTLLPGPVLRAAGCRPIRRATANWSAMAAELQNGLLYSLRPPKACGTCAPLQTHGVTHGQPGLIHHLPAVMAVIPGTQVLHAAGLAEAGQD
jgi:hypothetical protein